MAYVLKASSCDPLMTIVSLHSNRSADPISTKIVTIVLL